MSRDNDDASLDGRSPGTPARLLDSAGANTTIRFATTHPPDDDARREVRGPHVPARTSAERRRMEEEGDEV
jgi:hypothetical protein